MAEEPPSPKFQRFERVRVVGEPYHYPELCGRSGTILWRDCDWVRRMLPGMSSPAGWLYLVFFAPENAYRSLFESFLQSENSFDLESCALGTRPEFSFDVIMDDDMNYVEGTYRLPDRFWEVMVFKKENVPTMHHRPNHPPEWPSGITGTIFDVPRGAKLNRESIQQALAMAFGTDGWMEVQGPDSMVLR